MKTFRGDELYDIPTPSKKPLPSIIPPPFYTKHIAKFIFDKPKARSAPSIEAVSENLKMSPIAQGRYVFYLLYMGKHLQEAQDLLRNERRLDLQEVKKFVSVAAHPIFKSSCTKSDMTRKITDKSFMVWDAVIIDLLMMVQTYLLDFCLNYQITKLPDYSDLPNLVRDASDPSD